MKESVVVGQIKRYIKQRYPDAKGGSRRSWGYKTHGDGYQIKGLPDLIYCIEGRFVGIEVKQKGKLKDVTVDQKKVLRRIRAAGGVGFAADSVAMVERKLDRAVREGLLPF